MRIRSSAGVSTRVIGFFGYSGLPRSGRTRFGLYGPARVLPYSAVPLYAGFLSISQIVEGSHSVRPLRVRMPSPFNRRATSQSEQ
jgi:hypothetical protein